MSPPKVKKLKTVDIKDKSIDPELFLDHFAGHHIFARFDEVKGGTAPVHYHGGYDNAKKELVKFNNGEFKQGIFFTVNELNENLDPTNPDTGKQRHRTKAMAVRCRSLFMDADNKQSEPREDFPLEPSLVVNTSEGKYHYYWLIEDIIDKELFSQWEQVQNGLIDKYEGDAHARELNRVLRIPGYYHNKNKDNPFMVRLIGGNEKKYSWEELLREFPPSESERNIAGEFVSDNYQSLDEIYTVISTGADGLHGAINKVIIGAKKDGENKAKTFALIRTLGRANPVPLVERRQDYFSNYELERSWEGASEKEAVDLPDYVEPKTDIGEFPWPPDLYGELCADIYGMMKFQNRKIAFITATSLLSGITGRLYNIEGNGLNTYMLAVMGTGRGKDDIGVIINNTLNNVTADGMNLISGQSFIGPGRFTGPKAVIKSLKRALSQICVFSEAGLMLKSKAGDSQGLTRIMLNLYTASAVGHYSSKEEFSDDDKSIPSLHSPALSIVSESTEIMLMDVLKENNAIENGSLARQSIFRITGPKPYMNKDWQKGRISDACMAKLAELVSKASKIQEMNNHREHVIRIDTSDLKAKLDVWNDAYTDVVNRTEHSDSIRSIMAGRAYVKLLKYAGIATVANRADNRLRLKEAEWAKRFADYELDGVDNFFSETVLGDVLGDAALFLARNIHKMLTGGYSDRKVCPKPELIKKQQFAYSNIKQSAKNPNSPTSKLNDDAKRASHPNQGLDKTIEHMITAGWIFVVTKTPLGWRGGKIYGITDVFKEQIM